MIAVNTKNELKHALYSNEEIIHVTNRNLCLGIITRPHKFRMILLLYRLKGYRLSMLARQGSFDVKFMRK